MKINKDFVLRKLAGGYVATAVGSAASDFKGIIKLNETGAFIWHELESDISLDELCDKICANYSIDRDTAINDCEAIIAKLKQCGAIDE